MKAWKLGAFGVACVLLIGGCGGASHSSSQTSALNGLARVQKAGMLTWGTDVVGGVPYVYEDPKNPGHYTGFEMEIAQGVARHIGVELKLVVKAWDTLIPELQRGSFDMAMNGIEDTEDRRKIVLFSDPYFIYSQQITVRKGTRGIQTLDDLRGKRVATLSGTAAEDILRQKQIQVLVAPEVIYSYRDLEKGKADAVLLDTPIAAAYGASNPKLVNVGKSFNEGRYIIAFRQEDDSLRKAVNDALAIMKKNGELREIYGKYGIMDEHQNQIGI